MHDHDFDLKQYWNEEYKKHKEPWTEPDEVLVREVEGVSPGTAIDIGAGEGANVVWLAEKGWQVTAFDYAEEGIKTIKKIAEEKDVEIKTIVGDILAYEFEETYDLVYMAHLYMGPKHRPKMLANAASALAVEGTFIFIGVEPYEGMDSNHRDVLASTDEIAGLIEKIPGIQIDKTETIHRIVSYSGGSEEVDSIMIRAKRIE